MKQGNEDSSLAGSFFGRSVLPSCILVCLILGSAFSPHFRFNTSVWKKQAWTPLQAQFFTGDAMACEWCRLTST